MTLVVNFTYFCKSIHASHHKFIMLKCKYVYHVDKMYKMHSLRLPLHGSQWTNVHNVHCTCCKLGCNAISFIVVFTPCPSIYNCTYACHIKAEHMGANGAVEMDSEMGYCCFAILLGQLLSFLDHSKYFTGQNFSTSRYHKSFIFLQLFQMSKIIFAAKRTADILADFTHPIQFVIYLITASL